MDFSVILLPLRAAGVRGSFALVTKENVNSIIFMDLTLLGVFHMPHVHAPLSFFMTSPLFPVAEV